MQVGVVRKSSFGRLFFDFALVGFASTPLFIALAGGLKYDEDFVSAAFVNGILKTADYRELKTAIYGGEKYPLMAVMDIPYEL